MNYTRDGTAGLFVGGFLVFFCFGGFSGVSVLGFFFATSYMPTKHCWMQVTLIWEQALDVSWYWKEMSVSPIDTIWHTRLWLASSEKVTTVKQQYTYFHNLRPHWTLQFGTCEVLFAYLNVQFRICRGF